MTEAMLCGRPALVADVGGNAELIEEGSTGVVAEAPTPKSVQSALERAWLARERWEGMGKRSHEVMKARLSPSPEERLLSPIERTAREKQS